jgi:hypothetical protein
MLELSHRLAARILLLLEPLLCRGEGGGLFRQAGPQQLNLLSLFLGLALPGPRPLEGSAVLLELSSGRSQLPLKLCRQNPYHGRILTLLLQHLVPLQEHHPYLHDCGDISHNLGLLLQELVTHSLQPVIQPPAVGSQSLNESVQSVVLVPVPVALGAQLIEVVIPLSGPALKLLSTANRCGRRQNQKTRGCKGDEEKSRIQQQEYVP